MDKLTREMFAMGCGTGLDRILGPMDKTTRGNGNKTVAMEEVRTSGPTVGKYVVSGKMAT